MILNCKYLTWFRIYTGIDILTILRVYFLDKSILIPQLFFSDHGRRIGVDINLNVNFLEEYQL